MLKFTRETISPKKAKSMLDATESAGFVNRGQTKTFVHRYAGDMSKGHWMSDTGETIKVATNGAVIDGQHRLNAIIASGGSVKLWVCRGIDASMFQYIDQGKSRDLQDIMVIEGWENPRILAVTGKMLWRADRDNNSNPFASAALFSESDGNIYNWVLTVEPDLRREWKSYGPMIRNIYNSNHKSIPESLMFYLLYTWKKEDIDTALLFAGYLSEGPLGVPPHPAMAFFKEYAAELKMASGQVIGAGDTSRHGATKELLLKAANYSWDCIRSGKKIRTYNGFKTGLGLKTAAAAKIAA